ncbi:MAG: DUF2304 family protein [Patescibacteria group bacterium]|nr:DUF2304 family protein [Patescibacteria group bacterium]
MLLIQIFILGFVAFALWRTVGRFRAGELKRSALALWSVFWVALAVVTLLPHSTSWLASVVGVGRGVDVVIYLAIIVLFYLVFRIFLRLEKIEHDITLVVREMGLRGVEEGAEGAEDMHV